MRPFLVVPVEILGNLLLPDAKAPRQPVHALVLDRAIEPFEMRVIVWRPDTRMAMAQSAFCDSLREPLGEFGAMI